MILSSETEAVARNCGAPFIHLPPYSHTTLTSQLTAQSICPSTKVYMFRLDLFKEQFLTTDIKARTAAFAQCLASASAHARLSVLLIRVNLHGHRVQSCGSLMQLTTHMGRDTISLD